MTIDRLRRFIGDMTSLTGGAWQDKDEGATVEVGAKLLAELVKRPELVGMLDFLSEREDVRNLLALLKADPAMGEMVRQNIELAVGMGSQLQAADWTTASKGHDWGRVLQFAVEGQETAGRSPFN